jgi:cyclophilin family peptidyl-prolyl cis-trans isomerase
MVSKDFTSDRKRSRPVQKRKKTNIFKKNKLAQVFLVLIIAIIAVSAVFILYVQDDNSKDEQTDVIEDFNLDDNGQNDNGGNTDITGYPIAKFDTTKGEISIELYNDIAPNTCNNFIKLAQEGFYNGLIFHRIKDDFMIQAGKSYPDGTTKTSPYGNIIFEGGGTHMDGAISMASTAAGAGGSAEFFICDGAQTFLDGNYAAFGRVIEGIEVVRDIADDPHDGSLEPNPGGGKPLQDIIINSITINNS